LCLAETWYTSRLPELWDVPYYDANGSVPPNAPAWSLGSMCPKKKVRNGSSDLHYMACELGAGIYRLRRKDALRHVSLALGVDRSQG
jgi:hypothetical protein